MTTIISNTARFVGNVAYNTGTLAKDMVINVTVGTLNKWWEAGPFTKCAYKVYSLQGFEKLAKALEANLQLLARLPAIGDTFKKAQKSTADQRAVIFATLVSENFNLFIIEDKNTHTVQLGLPKKDLLTKVTTILYAIGSLCELGKYLQKYEGFKFEKCVELANKFGSFEIYGLKPATWPVLETLTHTPKAFFVFVASFCEVGSWVGLALVNLVGDSTTEAWKQERQDLVSTERLLKLTGSIGKAVLTSCGTFYGSQLWFAIVSSITQNASLISFFIKKADRLP